MTVAALPLGPQANYTVTPEKDYILVVDHDNGVAVAADVMSVITQMRKIGMVNDMSVIVLRDPFGRFDRVRPDGSLSYLDATSIQEALAV